MKLDDLLKDKKAVIFDMDGTLVDSMMMWGDIDREYLGRFGIEVPNDLHEAISGLSFVETEKYVKQRFNLPDPIEKIGADWNAMAMYKYTHEIPLKPGAMELLKELKKRGIKTGIATSNSPELLEAILDSVGIRDLIDEPHQAAEVAHGKPSPDLYIYVAGCLRVSPLECLVFEDVREGIMAGKAAGMQVVAVEDEYSVNQREEKKALADYYIDTFNDIL